MHKLIKKIFRRNKTDFKSFKSLVKNGAIIVDVRSNTEFKAGHIKGAVNIPAEYVSATINDLKNMNKPVITCCKSGIRSRMAASVLSSAGLEVYNGGAWNLLQGKI